MARRDGTVSAFTSLPQSQQQDYVDFSAAAVAAFLCWKRSQEELPGGQAQNYHEAWERLHVDDKAKWVPADPLAALSDVPGWAAIAVTRA